MSRTGVSRHMLSFADRFRLAKWVEEHKEELLTRRPTKPDLARQLSEVFKIHVTAGNTEGILEELNIYWEPKESNPTRRSSPLTPRLTALEAEVAFLRGMVNRLYSEMGLPVPGGAVPSKTVAVVNSK